MNATRIAALALLLAAGPGADAAAWAAPPPAEAAHLRYIDALYRAGDGFRAESEILRFLHAHPDHPWRGRVELVRAKLYYRAGRREESDLMLFSLLDRLRNDPARRPAARLLTLSLVRQHRLDEAEDHLWALDDPGRPALTSLRAEPAGAVDPGRAMTWSTWLPGSGFFLLGQPGKAAAALSLNLAFTAGAVIAYRQHNPGAALVLLLVELALYRGGREAVRDAALAHNRGLRNRRAESWVHAAGESALIGVGLELKFGAD